MAAPQQQKLRLRDRRRKRLRVRLIALGVLIVLCVAGCAYAVRLPAITISTVNVTGTELVSADAVKSLAEQKLTGSYAYLIPRANAFFAPLPSIQKAIQNSFPPVASVSVSRQGLTAIDIALTERQPSALWCEGSPSETGQCYLMDAEGYIFAISPDSGGYVDYYGVFDGNPIGKTYLSDFAILNGTVEGIGTSVKLTPKSVSVENGDEDVFLDFAEGGEVRFLRAADSQETIENVASVFGSDDFKSHSSFQYVDFRFGDKVYVKYK